MSDLDIHLAAIVAGDESAFAAWLAGAEAPLRASLRRFAAVVDVEAVLQEALLRVWHVAPRFESDGRPNSLLRMGHVVARNLAISETRKRGKPVPEPPAPLASPELPDPLLREVIARCREKLPSKPAQALDARLGAHGGTADATLAEDLGMTKNTFLQNFGRARKLLRDCLSNNGVRLQEHLA